jgi:Predicted membrane protein (DUF2142)
VTVAEPTVAPESGSPRRGRDLLGWFRSPLKTFLVLAIAAGVYLVCVVPHFAGIDEPAHFYRSYQISTGTFLPEKEGSKGFGGACIPRDVIRAQRADSRVFAAHNLQGLIDPETGKQIVYDPGPIQACPTDPSEGFITFSTFPSFVPYLPQAASVFVTRNLGLDTDAMLIIARFVVLAMYVALVAVAIARSPRSKWALAAVGLVPVAVFQSASSISHDAFTTAIALVVVSSALRALDPPEGTSTRALVIEAVLLSAVLGSVKPVYVVIAGLYLLPLLGPKRAEASEGVVGAPRRTDRWPLVFAPVVGVVATVLWNLSAGDVWKTDAGYFNIAVDDVTQKHELLHRPWDFGVDLVRAGYHELWHWVTQPFTVGPSVTSGPAILAILCVVIYAVSSLQRARAEAPAPLGWLQRVLILLAFLIGVVLIGAANYIYWTPPGLDRVEGIQPRYFVPLLVLLPVAIGSLPWKWADTARARVPIPVLLAPTLVAFCAIVTFRMY